MWISRIAEGYYMLAGEAELAQRLRPATRRKGRPATESDASPEGETLPEETPTEEAPTEEAPPAEVTEATAPAPSPTDA